LLDGEAGQGRCSPPSAERDTGTIRGQDPQAQLETISIVTYALFTGHWVEPPWGVEPQTYALRVPNSSLSPCAPSPSVHVTMNTVHRARIRRTPLEATKEATQRSSARVEG
jgi:hypothetical protein